MTASLAQTRCYHHSHREAVARCPDCARYFCRECISDYQGKALCAQCLSQSVRETIPNKRIPAYLLSGLCALAGFMLTWFLFYMLATLLIRIPSEFHEGWGAL